MTSQLTAPDTSAPPTAEKAGSRADLVAVAIALVLVAVSCAVGDALLDAGVPLYLQAPPLLARVMPHLGIGTPFAIVLGMLGALYAVRISACLRWTRLGPLAVVTAIGWTSSLALIDGSSHPPGATLVFLVLDRVGLGGGGWAGAVVIAIGSTAGIAACVTVHQLGAPDAARRILPFAVFFPGAVWVGVSADGLFAGVAAWGIALAVIGSRRGGRGGLLTAGAGGLLLGYTAYLSCGLVLIGAVVLTAFALGVHQRVWLATLAGAVVVAAAFTLAGFDWLQGERLLTIRYYQGVASGRPYSYFVWADLAALTLSAGPAVAAGLRRAVVVVSSARLPSIDRETLVPAALSLAAAAVLVADLTGLSKAETERIWLPFGFWLIASLALLPKRAVPAALTLQIVIALLVNHLELTYW